MGKLYFPLNFVVNLNFSKKVVFKKSKVASPSGSWVFAKAELYRKKKQLGR